MASPITIEKHHISITVAASAAFTLILLAFTAGKSTGSATASMELGFSQVNAQMAEIKVSMLDAEKSRKEESSRLSESISQLSTKVASLQSQVDDLKIQVQHRSPVTR